MLHLKKLAINAPQHFSAFEGENGLERKKVQSVPEKFIV